MTFLKIIFPILFLSVSLSTYAQDKKFKIHTLAFYNLENVFDTINDPLKFDDYSPIMELKTNRGAAYKRKITNMARVIADIGKDITTDAPAILGVCEVENKTVLEDLINDPQLLDKNYGMVHYESPDVRGIDVALLYQKSLFTSLQTIDPYAKVFIMGDLNDDPLNPSVKTVLKAKRKRKKVGFKGLYNPFENFYRDGLGTTAYRDNWSLFDQIIISKPLLKKDYTSYRYYKAGIFNKNYLITSTGKYKGYPFRSWSGGGFSNGFSDHFPVYMYVIKEVE